MKAHNTFFTISEFAELFNIHKKTLYYYDQIGLFKPEYVNENGYRYYSDKQTYDFHILLALKDLQMSLEDTKMYTHHRTPETMICLLDHKVEELDNEIKKLTSLKHSISKRLSLLKSAVQVPIDEIQVKYREEEYLRLEPIEVKDGDDTNYMTWHNVFGEGDKHQLNEGAYGQMVLYENLIANHFCPDYISIEARYDKERQHSFVKPKGNYVIGRRNGKVLHSTTLYNRLITFIKENNLEIIGNSYEFFIVDGSFASDCKDRVLEIQIHVK